ncbi:MAG: bifunctional phosphoribosylaminoimidazolecarboxamide formyltransferase/IMP cyclohydrolase, partial [Armatimonadota bacterium]
MRVRRALISVYDKRGVVEFARGLTELGVEIISTGNTARELTSAGIPVIPVDRVTGFPEMLDGRVKTLHPAVHAGILADRSRPDHMMALEKSGITPIDLVVSNLYPFRETVARPSVTVAEAMDNVDIGGPAMIRAAAKNWASVGVVVDPNDYSEVLRALEENDVCLPDELRFRLAAKAFAHTAAYDAAISSYFESMGEGIPPQTLVMEFHKTRDLRYGENPHQRGAFYAHPNPPRGSVAVARQISGKDLSFTNILDLDAALELVKDFDKPAAAIIKHTNPCGVAVADTLVEAFISAREA